MSRNIVETVLGAIVIVVAGGFLTWAYSRSSIGDPGGYELVAMFDKADGIGVGSEVKVSGIKVGQVLSQKLNTQTYRAEVVFSVDGDIELPLDTSAAIVSSGLLGGKYLALVPGAEDTMLKPGEEITLTQSSVNLEDLIGQFIFSQQGES
ncbi:MAG: outer membrane lipid asymmetry maintenance protein MlaD [Geminicoccaceae bacterium]|nr:outer membrane lipid asymmetry maintenance protein MlaD [Geminicoccaceae bacterium]